MNDWLSRLILFFFARRYSSIETPDLRTPLHNRSTEGDSTRNSNDRCRKPCSSPIDTSQLATQLELGKSALQQSCSGAEADFLNIGERLQTIYAQAGQITRTAHTAVEHIGLDTENSALATITRTAYQALADFDLEQSRMAERMQNIGSICEHLRHLHDLTGVLNRIAKALKMVAININIESCRAAESRDSFSVLSKEIRELSDTVASLARSLRSEIQTMTGSLETSQQAMSADLDRFAQLAADARKVAEQAGPECRDLMNRAVKVLKQVGANAEAISRGTSQIVVSLQIHDNVSQRIEHIAEALTDARQLLLHSDHDSREEGVFLESIAAVDANLDLQQAQLSNIINDIEHVFQNSGQAFKAIGSTISDITEGILTIARGDESPHSGGKDKTGSIGSLQATLEKIRNLIGRGREAVEGLMSMGREATSAVARIGEQMEQVRKVNFDIHLKSLNAIFKSTHLGDRGRSIGVLVQEMKELATQSNDLVEQIESTNGNIMKQADQLKAQLRTTDADGQGSDAINSEVLDRAAQEFFETSAAFTRHADEMAALSQSLDGLIVAAESKLLFLQPFAGQLKHHQDQLKECRVRLAPWVEAAGGSSALNKACLAERYTMQQERDIHTTILEAKTVRSGAHSERKATAGVRSEDPLSSQILHDETEENELGDNVELF